MLNKRVSCIDCGHKAFPHQMRKNHGSYQCHRCYKAEGRRGW